MLTTISHFPGFYESCLSAMIDDEVESIFNTDDSGCNSAIPEAFYWAKVDYAAIHEAQSKAYAETWLEKFQEETGIELKATYESTTSPKYYNFETDRLFLTIDPESVTDLFKASESDNHKQLETVIKERFTSRSGFWSHYSNDIDDWLSKPVLTWDHNEVSTLLDAVLAIHGCTEPFDTWDLMERFQCNGDLSNAVWSAIPEKLRNFADLQREHGKALDYEVFKETGEAFDPDSGEPMPPLRCKQTIEMNLSASR